MSSNRLPAYLALWNAISLNVAVPEGETLQLRSRCRALRIFYVSRCLPRQASGLGRFLVGQVPVVLLYPFSSATSRFVLGGIVGWRLCLRGFLHEQYEFPA